MKASQASIVVVVGLGAYTFAYARGWAYLTDNPGACANCHVMHEQYDGWIKSSHRSVAVCNDCHVPHDFVGKYATKARNGFWHSYYFTTGAFPEPIRATPRSRDTAEANCRRCHEPVVEAMGSPARTGTLSISCVRCHGSVGHMELSATNVADAEVTHD
jgi:cytochrome c nitrite reductase small subunit